MPSFLRALTQNWQLKLLAFALAVLLWVVVSAEQITSSWIPVPLQVQATDPNYQLLPGSAPDEVEVRFTGPGRDLVDVAIRQPPVLLTIDRVTEPEETFPLEPGMVQVPNQLAANPQDVRPGVVRLRFRRLATRLLPVQVVVERGLAGGLTLVDSLRVNPARIEVRGPAERVEALEALSTAPINLPPSDSVFSRVVPLDTTQLRGLSLGSRRVRVSGQVDRVIERVLPNVPISRGPGIAVRPSSVDVRLTGAASLVRAVRPADFRVVLAIDSIPSRIPAEGVPVPLRVEELRRGVRAALGRGTVRLLPVRPPADTLPEAGDTVPEPGPR